MCVAGPKDFTEDQSRALRVATKFGNIAKRYYAAQGRDRERLDPAAVTAAGQSGAGAGVGVGSGGVRMSTKGQLLCRCRCAAASGPVAGSRAPGPASGGQRQDYDQSRRVRHGHDADGRLGCTHTILLCLGQGLSASTELLDALNACGDYVLLIAAA